MRLSKTAVLLSLFCSLQVFAQDGGSGRTSNDQAALERLLAAEAKGQPVDRRANTNPKAGLDSAWQAGLLQRDGQLVAMENLKANDVDRQYQEKRRELFGKPDWHEKLALWCIQNKMPERARAHYFALIARNPNHEQARKFLGHVRVGNRWFDKNDMDWAKNRAQEAMDSLDRWFKPIHSVVLLLHRKDTRASQKAFKKLDEIQDPKSIHALEFFASNVDDDFAKPLVNKLTEFRSQESCLSLLRIALSTGSSELRTFVTRKIRTYPQEMYLPELLPLLQGDTEVASQIIAQPNGKLALVTLVAKELQGEKHVRKIQNMLSVASVFSSGARASLTENSKESHRKTTELAAAQFNGFRRSHTITTAETQSQNSQKMQGNAGKVVVDTPPALSYAASQSLFEQGRQAKASAARQHRITQENCESIYSLLRGLTGQDLPDKAELWWQWWTDEYERLEGTKPTYHYASTQRRDILVNTRRYAETQGAYNRDFGTTYSYFYCRCTCLVAGTLIQTSTGLKAVEKIQVGDLVAAQNIETGELSLRPVVMTTIRPPKSTVLIETENGLIEATGGHMWWVGGKGWVMARDLKPGMQLRTAKATTEVQSIKENIEPQKTYNLVVDADHSYFVGKERVLSYDNTTVKGTLRTVPGFDNATAKK